MNGASMSIVVLALGCGPQFGTGPSNTETDNPEPPPTGTPTDTTVDGCDIDGVSDLRIEFDGFDPLDDWIVSPEVDVFDPTGALYGHTDGSFGFIAVDVGYWRVQARRGVIEPDTNIRASESWVPNTAPVVEVCLSSVADGDVPFNYILSPMSHHLWLLGEGGAWGVDPNDLAGGNFYTTAAFDLGADGDPVTATVDAFGIGWAVTSSGALLGYVGAGFGESSVATWRVRESGTTDVAGSRDGTLWFASAEGVVAYDPAAIRELVLGADPGVGVVVSATATAVAASTTGVWVLDGSTVQHHTMGADGTPVPGPALTYASSPTDLAVDPANGDVWTRDPDGTLSRVRSDDAFAGDASADTWTTSPTAVGLTVDWDGSAWWIDGNEVWRTDSTTTVSAGTPLSIGALSGLTMDP